MTESPRHFNAKTRLFYLVLNTHPCPSVVDREYVYPNPKNLTGDPKWDWKFDCYTEIIFGDKNFRIRKIAMEVDGQNRDGEKGHSSKKSFEKREFKKQYLKSKGIELYAWPRPWIIGRKALPDEDFLKELNLVRSQEWFNM
jgi:hypothetical protein